MTANDNGTMATSGGTAGVKRGSKATAKKSDAGEAKLPVKSGRVAKTSRGGQGGKKAVKEESPDGDNSILRTYGLREEPVASNDGELQV